MMRLPAGGTDRLSLREKLPDDGRYMAVFNASPESAATGNLVAGIAGGLAECGEHQAGARSDETGLPAH